MYERIKNDETIWNNVPNYSLGQSDGYGKFGLYQYLDTQNSQNPSDSQSTYPDTYTLEIHIYPKRKITNSNMSLSSSVDEIYVEYNLNVINNIKENGISLNYCSITGSQTGYGQTEVYVNYISLNLNSKK
jgi:hypothetical protein